MGKFSFNIKELEQNTTADTKANSGGAKFFDAPGTYDVKVSVEKDEPKDGANSHWHGLRLKLTDSEGRGVTHFVDYPVTSELTNTLNSGEQVYYSYSGLKRFLVGCGVAEKVNDIHSADMATIVPKLFSDCAKMFNGKSAKVTLAWKKSSVHCQYADGFYFLANEKNEPINEEKFEVDQDNEDKKAAHSEARELCEAEAPDGMAVEKFMKVVGLVFDEPLLTEAEGKSKPF